MTKAKLLAVEARIEPEQGPVEDFIGDAEGQKEYAERVRAGTASMDTLMVRVEYGLLSGGANYRIHHTGDSLGGVQSLTGTAEERSQATDYIRSEFHTMIDELARELHENVGLPAGRIKKAGRDAVENLLYGNGTKARVEVPW